MCNNKWCIFMAYITMLLLLNNSLFATADNNNTPGTATIRSYGQSYLLNLNGTDDITDYVKIQSQGEGKIQLEITATNSNYSVTYIVYDNIACTASDRVASGTVEAHDYNNLTWSANSGVWYYIAFSISGGSQDSYSNYNFNWKSSTPPPGKATNPDPSNGSTNQPINKTLSWQTGGNTIKYYVYFGTQLPIPFKTTTTKTTYNPGTLSYGTTYIWRIDSENEDGIQTAGDQWSFTTISNPPVISVTPNSHDYGSVEVGQYLDKTFTVKNIGGGTLSGSASVSSPFSIVFGGSYNLNSGQSQIVTVRFTPTAAQYYSRNVSFTGGGGATRQVSGTGFIAPTTGDLQVKVSNINGGSTEVPKSNGIVKLYKNNSFVEQQTTVATNDGTGSGIATFTDKDAGSDYSYEVFHNPNPSTIFGQEFWGKKNSVSISAGETTTSNFTRYMPFLTDIRVFNGTTDITGQDVAPGTPLKIKVTIQNNGSAINTRVRLVMDRNKDTSYDFDETSSTASIGGAGSTHTFEFNYTPTEGGSYYAIASPSVYIDSEWRVTDGQYWNDYLKFRVTAGNLNFYVEDENNNYTESAYILLDPGDINECSGTTNASGYHIFYNLPYGTHEYKVFNHETQDATRELWGVNTFAINQEAVAYTHIRDIDYIKDMQIYQNGQGYPNGSSFNAGSEIYVQMLVNNDATSSDYNMRITMIIDRDQSIAYDEEQQQTRMITAGSNYNFSFPFTIPQSWAGETVYIIGKVEAYVNGEWVQTSIWQWNFYFNIVGDDVPPQVSSTTPANGESDWTIDQRNIIVEFNEAINASTVNTSTFIVSLNGVNVPGQISQVTSNIYKFTADNDLVYGETYTCKLTTGITDLSGNSLDGDKDGIEEGSTSDDYIWSFNTVMLNSTRLAVPYYSQEFSGWCAAASMSMLLKYWGIKKTTEEIASYFHIRTTSSGLSADDFIPFLQNEIGVAFEKWIVKTIDLGKINSIGIWLIKNYIIKNINNGRPIWFGSNLNTIKGDGHAVVITGYDNEHVYFNDPGGYFISRIDPNVTDIELQEYKASWSDFNEKILGYDWGLEVVEHQAITINDNSLTATTFNGSVYLPNNTAFTTPGNITFYPKLAFVHRSNDEKFGLKLYWDATKPYGYKYIILNDDAQYYNVEQNLGYKATVIDSIQFGIAVANSGDGLLNANMLVVVENTDKNIVSYVKNFNVIISPHVSNAYIPVFGNSKNPGSNSNYYTINNIEQNNNNNFDDDSDGLIDENLLPSILSLRQFTPGNYQLKAYIRNNGLIREDSCIYKFYIEDIGIITPPSFDPVTGIYQTDQNVEITCTPSDATIYYTTDGTEPTENSTLYTVPINVSTSMTLKARAYKTGWITSDIGQATYTITGSISTPIFDPGSGTYTTPQNVTISCIPSDATIHYTTNGNDPTENDPIYSGPIEVASSMTLKARGYKAGWTPSEVGSANYIIGTNSPPNVTAVTPVSGKYKDSILLSATSNDPDGDTIIKEKYQYSLNGSTNWLDICEDDTPNDGYSWTSGLNEATVWIRAKAYDGKEWGNWFTAQGSFMIDNTPPVFSNWSTDPDTLTVNSTGGFTVSLDITDDLSGIIQYTPQLAYKIGPDEYTAYSDMTKGTGNTWLYIIPEPGCGWSGRSGEILYYKVQSRDNVGNLQIEERNKLITISSTSQITITAPAGGENWTVGSSQDITWTSSGTSGNVKVEYSYDNGSNWCSIIASTSDDGSYSWTVPNTPSTQCLVKITDTDGSPSDQSDAVFTISPFLTHFTPVDPTGRTQPVYINDATLDGTQLQPGDEIGIYDDTLCVGAGKVTSFPMTDPIIVYLEYTPPGGTPLPGAHDGNNMSFKVWDQSEDREEDAKISEVVSGTPVFAEGAIVSLKLEAPCELTQQITIQPNKLNLISFYVTPENLDASAVFDSLTNFVVAFNDNGKYRIPPDIVYPGHPGTNTIGDIEPCEGYSIFISGDTPQTLSLTGFPIDASSLVCTVDNGKLNKISFPKQNTQPIADVFNATANPDLWSHFVVAFDDEGQYFIPPDIVFPGHPGTNSIGDMVPGKGYSLFHNGDSPITYNFPESAGSPPLAKANAKKENSFSGPDHFTFVKTGKPHAVFLRNEGLILEQGDELAVFSGDNCVGAMKYEGSLSDPLVIWRAVEEYDLPGIEDGDNLSLRCYRSQTQTIETLIVEGDVQFNSERPFSLLYLKGSLIPGGIHKLSSNIPEKMSLYQNYPNPFNPETTIRFDINESCNVTILVYNIKGQVVSKLVDKFMSKGEYSVMWDGKTDNGNRVGAGVYLVHLRAGKFSFTRKVLLVE